MHSLEGLLAVAPVERRRGGGTDHSSFLKKKCLHGYYLLLKSDSKFISPLLHFFSSFVFIISLVRGCCLRLVKLMLSTRSSGGNVVGVFNSIFFSLSFLFVLLFYSI